MKAGDPERVQKDTRTVFQVGSENVALSISSVFLHFPSYFANHKEFRGSHSVFRDTSSVFGGYPQRFYLQRVWKVPAARLEVPAGARKAPVVCFDRSPQHVSVISTTCGGETPNLQRRARFLGDR